MLALWGTKGVVNRLFNPIVDWKSAARDVRGKPLPSGHFLAEEVPEETLAELLAFFGAGTKPATMVTKVQGSRAAFAIIAGLAK